jgi:hypothetical protein
MLNAKLKGVVVVVLAAGTVSGCVAPRSENAAFYSKDPREQAAQALQEMKERRQPDPQVPGWVFVNPQQARPTIDP